MEIDIRANGIGEVDTIRIASEDIENDKQVELLVKYLPAVDNTTALLVNNTSQDRLYIYDKLHAQYIIKALNKAIELGWFK